MTVGEIGTAAMVASAVLLGLAAVLGLGRRTATPAALCAAAGCAGLMVLGLAVIVGPVISARMGDVLGFTPVDVRYDPLAGTFLLVLGSIGVAASIFAIGYHGAQRSRLDGLVYPVFLGAMALVIGAADIFAFLLAWELMALTSAVLVVGPTPGHEEARAGFIYLAMTHLATAAIVVAFAILAAGAGTLQIAGLATSAATLPELTRDAVFLLLLVGFGTKAGMVPLHVWLPRAHPVAPSHVSALMSGVMVAIGSYALLRFCVGVLGAGPMWWALLGLALGAVSAVVGALYALAERDLKRLLAFSTIENSGIVLLGFGTALFGASIGNVPLETLGITAALFHVLSHGSFKGLLFLGAGAVQQSAGSRDLDRLGGLVRVMPWTAALFCVGAVAGTSLPPLTGYASEWLTFQGLLASGGTAAADGLSRFAAYLAVGTLGLAAALGLATYVKATGMSFLALPRSDDAAHATEAGRPMRVAMALLAIGCVGLGLLAVPTGTLLQGVAQASLASASGPVITASPATLGTWAPILVAIALGCLLVAGWALARVRTTSIRHVPTWTCGIPPEPAFEYTATSFEKPVRLFFESFYRPEREVRVELVPGTPFRSRVRYRSEVDHLAESWLYRPLHRFGLVFAQTARRLQQGTLQLYVAYMVVAVLVLLLLAR
jgi:hydrogenase-4 component B